MGARTVTEFLQLGGTWADLKNDSDRGYIIKDTPDSKPFLDAANLGWVRAPKGLSKTHDKEVRLAEARHAEAAERYAAHQQPGNKNPLREFLTHIFLLVDCTQLDVSFHLHKFSLKPPM